MFRSAVIVALSLSSLTASASTWSDFESAFPTFPCVDGWSACHQGGALTSPEPARDEGLLRRSGSRIDFFSLEPVAGFDAHMHSLSGFPVDPTEVVAVVPPVAPPVEVVAPMDVATNEAHAPEPEGAARKAKVPNNTVVSPERGVDAQPKQPAVQAATSQSCRDLSQLEPFAAMGRLTPAQIGEVEATLQAAKRNTDKARCSLLLIGNAWVADRAAWETLTLRHLESIDQSDPDLAYAYARVMVRKGPSRAPEALHWAGVAGENRTRWTGRKFRDNVYDLHKLETMAHQSMWQQAATARTEAPTSEAKTLEERHRDNTKVAARDWYEFAHAAEMDDTKPLMACMSASGARDYCTGS